MALTYDEFKKIVPKETSDFFDELLPHLAYYIDNGYDIRFTTTPSTAYFDESKAFFLSLYVLGNIKEYAALLGPLGYKRSNYHIDNKNIDFLLNKEELYEKYNYLIPVYEDKTLYYNLRPTDIVHDTYNTYYNKGGDRDLFREIITMSSYGQFKHTLLTSSQEQKQIQEREIEKEIYKQVPISVISYIETASKIRTILINKLTYSENSICKKLDTDLVPLSLFLALFFNVNNSQNELDNQNAIVYLLDEKGITLEKIKNILGVNIQLSEINTTPKNIYAIKDLYNKYYQNGNSINMSYNNLSVQGIIKNILNRNFTKSLVIDKLLTKLGCNTSMFKNIEQDSIRAIENKKLLEEQENIKIFYKDIPKKTRDFMEFTVKTYSLLLEKMNEKKYNAEILATEEDASILALYIASNYYNSNISEFFNDNGVTFQKILKLLNIEIKKEEIEQRKLDRSILIDKYGVIIYGGENKKHLTCNLSINDICLNICNRNISQSMILENIFNSLSPTTQIDSNFSTQLKKHLIDKENKRKIEKTEKFFKDMPIETIKMLEEASSIYKKILKSSRGLNKKGAQSISILLSILNSDCEDAKEVFEYFKLDKEKIYNYFNLDKYNLFNSPSDIDLLIDEYGLLIFGLNNSNKKREEITPISIAKNIFLKEFNNSVAIKKFLSEFDLDYDNFSDFDSVCQKNLEKKIKEKRKGQIELELYEYPEDTRAFLLDALIINCLLNKEKEAGNFDDSLLTKDSDLEVLSILLSFFKQYGKIQDFFKNNGLTENIIKATFKLNPNFQTNCSNIVIDYDILKERYFKYLKGGYNRSTTHPEDIIKNILKESDLIKRISESNNIDYEKLKKEIETGKNFEETITLNDRITKLNSTEVKELESSNMQDILEFGNELVPHSKYIHSELPKMIENNDNETSISTINRMISNMIYTKEETQDKQQGFLARLFNNEPEKAPVKVMIDTNKLYQLQNYINNIAEKLKQELLKFDEFRKYIEEYSKINRMYLQKTNDALTKLSSSLEKLDPAKRKELLRINQAIVSHFVTINSLEMARDDLIPLIESELAIVEGENNEKNALDLSKNIMDLFQSLLTRDVESTIQNMEKLQKRVIPDELAATLTNDVNTYIQGVNQIKALEEKIGNVEEKTATKEKTLGKTYSNKIV